MKSLAVILCLVSLFVSSAFAAEADSTFRFHIANEPSGLNPLKQRTSSSSYVLGNLYRNLFTYDNDLGLIPDLAQELCQRKKNILTCKIKKNLKWSDGTPLTSADFLRSYQALLDSKNTYPRADLLFKVRGAEQVYKQEIPFSKSGFSAPDKYTLRFEFPQSPGDFEYNLSHFLTAPTPTQDNVFSGPYKLKEWKKGQKLLLTPNTFYHGGNSQRPEVEVFFIEEDTVALQLYEKGQLQFLRRLPTLFIPKFKTRKDFLWVPVTRFDYLGFGPELKDKEEIRKAFTYSLNFPELQRIFSSEGRPGCWGVPDSWFPDKAPCFEYDLKKVPTTKATQSFSLMFSSLGGEDHKRATEWLQDQWRKHAHLKTQLLLTENKIFLQTLRQNPPAIFRKGGAPNRPTCLAMLESFSENNPENYIQLKSQDFMKLLSRLELAEKKNEQKQLCKEGVDYLMNHHLLIPLGAIHFSMLVKPEFEGWKLNHLNHLDLSNLKFKH